MPVVRTVGRCTVTWLPNFLGWVVYHIFLPMVLLFARESSAISLNWPLLPPLSQILSDGNARKEHENFRAMSDERTDLLPPIFLSCPTYGRVFSSLPWFFLFTYQWQKLWLATKFVLLINFNMLTNIYEPLFVENSQLYDGVVTNYREVKNIDFQWASWRKHDHFNFNKSVFFLVFSQTSDMQWTYDILGTTADYNPPNARARITSTSANSARRTVKQKKNYVLENLKLQSTAVSSPYKGVRLTSRSARWQRTSVLAV